jgi:F-type H+-transporting ATPase subunit delta
MSAVPDEAPASSLTQLAPTVFDETADEIARVYGEALRGAAEKAGQVDEVLEELDAVHDLIVTKLPAFADLLGSNLQSVSDKDRLLSEAFDGRTTSTTAQFLRVLNRHGRIALLGPILRAAHASWDRRQNRHPVLVRSAVPLSEPEVEALRRRLEASLGGTPVLRMEVDPALIGGLVVRVGDDLYDNSVRNRLEQLRQRLIEGKTHEIQGRRDHFRHPE